MTGGAPLPSTSLPLSQGRGRGKGKGRVRVIVSLPRVGTRGFREAGGLDHMTKHCVLIASHPS